MFGAQVVETAAKKLKKLNPKPIEVTVRVTRYKISITDAESHIHLDNEDVRLIATSANSIFPDLLLLWNCNLLKERCLL